MKLKKEIYDVLIDAVDNGIDDEQALDFAIRDAAAVIKLICKFLDKHDLASECGGEWLYQSDSGQVDALELVSDILECLKGYSDNNEE